MKGGCHVVAIQPWPDLDEASSTHSHLRPLTAGLAAFPAHASMDGDEKQLDDWATSRKNRLPSFAEVLSRRTRPPVDLFMF